MNKSTIIGATPEQVNENTFGRLYKVSQNSTGGIDCDMYCFIKDVEQKDQQIADMEAKLTENENEIKKLICDYESRITKNHELMSWLEHENEKLKQQLAEKEEEIKKLKSQFHHMCKGVRRYDFGELLIENTQLKVKHNQDKISFAVEQLKKVKADLVNKVSPVKLSYNEYVQEVFNKINNQIEELKKEMK